MNEIGFILFQNDAGVWCAAPPGFRNADDDFVGWGETDRQAVKSLLARPDYQNRAAAAGWKPTLCDFAVVSSPRESV